MGVDGIDKGNLPAVNPAAEEHGSVDDVGRVEPAATEAIRSAEGAAGRSEAPVGSARATASEALERLRRGEIDKQAYLEARADAAIAHLEGVLPPDQLEVVRETLRAELEHDPVLVELVRRTLLGAPVG